MTCWRRDRHTSEIRHAVDGFPVCKPAGPWHTPPASDHAADVCGPADGAFIHPLSGVADSKLVDRDLMIYALKAGYGRKGARIGSRDGDAELFKADMLAFWRRTLG